MNQTIIEKIISNHSNTQAKPNDIVDIHIDARAARDFGGANVVKNIQDNGLSIEDPSKTFFTFDCNPGGSDQKYATNQQICRLYSREQGINVYDIDQGIGTHLAIDNGLIGPGGTFVSTDSHANILGAIGAFGQGMGDQDIAHAWAYGKVWFKVPETYKVVLTGPIPAHIQAKDITFALLKEFGANGLLGVAAEFYGDAVEALDLDDRITIASMATEMGGIIALFPPSPEILDYCSQRMGQPCKGVYADPDAVYTKTITIDLSKIKPMVALPGHPEDVVPVQNASGKKIDSVFIGSCTNGRMKDMRLAASILKDRKVAPGVVLKIVPATDKIWQQCLDESLIKIFKNAGALVSNSGCAGCAAGQIGQNGPNEITVSTGNRNFAGKQGKGEVYLASPATAAASAIAGVLTTIDSIPNTPVLFESGSQPKPTATVSTTDSTPKPTQIQGRAWVINQDNIDTDMIYHNRYLTITDIDKMGQYTFDNLKGWEDFAQKAQPGDIVVTGKNFGAGSSRQQAVDCFKSLGISLVIAQSFGAIYERNAINAGFPIMQADLIPSVQTGQTIHVDFETGQIKLDNSPHPVQGTAFPDVQIAIYKKGGLLKT